MTDPVEVAPGSYCGCCGHECNDDLWCDDCAGHVLDHGHLWERTWFAQHGTDCPHQVASRVADPAEVAPGVERRWSHCVNALASHAPQPGDRWPSPDDDMMFMSVCQECGYYIWLVADWDKWPSRSAADG